jgi:hypothetical protein
MTKTHPSELRIDGLEMCAWLVYRGFSPIHQERRSDGKLTWFFQDLPEIARQVLEFATSSGDATEIRAYLACRSALVADRGRTDGGAR